MRFHRFKLILFLAATLFLCLPLLVLADVEGQKVNFSVEPIYDASQREKLSATLVYIGSKLYFYTDDQWWNSLTEQTKQNTLYIFNNLSLEFENKIYSVLTATFGSEWRPGIDRDDRITVLIHPMAEEAGGYFNSGDEYDKTQNPKSNQREMIYLNTSQIDKAGAKSFLAHEFVHLLTFNQKERIFNTTEEVWLNEARAEYAATLLGYDDVYETSNLRRRIRAFLDKPNDSLVEWQGKSSDYGALNLFTQYLVDHYGIKILTDSLKMRKVGIDSLNEALKQNGFKENFSQIFTNWTIAILINDCSYGQEYCYLNATLQNFRVAPLTHFLPIVGESNLSVVYNTKAWAGNWYKILGGREVLKLEFFGKGTSFTVPYIIEDSQGKFKIGFLSFDNSQKGTIYAPDFGFKNRSLIILPSVQLQTTGAVADIGSDTNYQFSFSASTVKSTPEQEAELINQLLAKIDYLKKEIIRLQLELAKKRGEVSCLAFEKDLYYGMMNFNEVKCLQQFLKSKGENIYPEGIVSGKYLSLTTLAVKRYQASKGIIQTGYFGPLTRTAANADLGL